MRQRALLLALACALVGPGLASADEPAAAPPAPEAFPPPPPTAPPPPPPEAPAPPRRDREFALWVGLGDVYADTGNKEAKGYGGGVFASAEYAFRASSWFSPRLYSGLMYTSAAKGSCNEGVSPCDVSGRFVFAGGKVRVTAPIPWVAPFAELGLGLSAGRFSTRVGSFVDQTTSGLVVHVPVGLGVALGPHRGLQLSLQYLVHGSIEQDSVALAVALRF